MAAKKIEPILDTVINETIWPIQIIISKKNCFCFWTRSLDDMTLDDKITSMMTKDGSIISNGKNQYRSLVQKELLEAF